MRAGVGAGSMTGMGNLTGADMTNGGERPARWRLGVDAHGNYSARRIDPVRECEIGESPLYFWFGQAAERNIWLEPTADDDRDVVRWALARGADA